MTHHYSSVTNVASIAITDIAKIDQFKLNVRFSAKVKIAKIDDLVKEFILQFTNSKLGESSTDHDVIIAHY